MSFTTIYLSSKLFIQLLKVSIKLIYTLSTRFIKMYCTTSYVLLHFPYHQNRTYRFFIINPELAVLAHLHLIIHLSQLIRPAGMCPLLVCCSHVSSGSARRNDCYHSNNWKKLAFDRHVTVNKRPLAAIKEPKIFFFHLFHSFCFFYPITPQITPMGLFLEYPYPLGLILSANHEGFCRPHKFRLLLMKLFQYDKFYS